MSDIQNLREEYSQHSLLESQVAPDPIEQFKAWFQDAMNEEIQEPNIMTLATASPDGKPSARIVLLKGVSDKGFTFFTNYNGRKGKELTANPHCALVFFWQALQRQVRVEGRAHKITGPESDGYFQSRPRGSQLGAWASPQSERIPDRDSLERMLESIEAKWESGPIPRPEFWGGFRLVPTLLEFWQGRPSRLHDRIQYVRDEQGEWQMDRLAP